MDIYIRFEVDGTEVREGPYSLRDVQRKLAEGTLQVTDPARDEGMLGKEHWVPLGDLPKVSISFQQKGGKEIHLSKKSASILRRKSKVVRKGLTGEARRKKGSAGFIYLLAFAGIAGTFSHGLRWRDGATACTPSIPGRCWRRSGRRKEGS